MRKLKLVALFIIFSPLAILLNALNVNAQAIDNPLADPTDLFVIASPTANSKIKGTIPVAFRIYDDEQQYINFQASLHDAATCNTTSYGNIAPRGLINSHQSQNSGFNWNTETTLATNNLADGKYCFKICAQLLNGTEPYSICNSRIIDIINDNEKPVITSTPQKLKYFEGETFNYQITATDPDNDPLTYRLVVTSDFLSINPATGLVTSTPLTTLGHGGLIYTVTVAVSDGLSGETTQTFAIEIYKQQTTPTPNPNPNPQPNPNDPGKTPTDPEPQQPVTQLSFEVPTKNTVFTDELNLIKWKLPESNYKSIKLEYSQNLTTWSQVGETFSGNRSYYLWDVKDIEDGKYYLRLTVENQAGLKTQVVSEQFEINLETDEDPDVTSSPIITNEMPENNAEITDVNAKISATFLPSLDEEFVFDSFTIALDGLDIMDSCNVTTINFECTLSEPLTTGRHLVTASFKDTSDQTATREWTFTVKGEDLDNDDNNSDDDTVILFGREIPRSGVILIGIILCIGAALLFIPWILYSIWSRDDEDTKQTKITQTTTTELPPLDNSTYIAPYDPNSVYDINSGSDYTYTPPSNYSTTGFDTTSSYPSDTSSTLPSYSDTTTDYTQTTETTSSSTLPPLDNYEPLAPAEPLAPKEPIPTNPEPSAPQSPDNLNQNNNTVAGQYTEPEKTS